MVVALVLVSGGVSSAEPAPSAPRPPPPVEVESPGYITIQFGRTQWSTGRHCSPLPRTVDLGVVADAMTERGLVGTGSVVVDRTPETGIGCYNGYALHPAWDWMLRMQRRRGWSFVSQSRSYLWMTRLTYEEQVEQSCGSLPDFDAHGILHADALFAYPANQWTPEIQADPVSGCFSYGRRYLSNSPNVRSEMAPPWFAAVTSVSGGRCSDPTLPCHTRTGTGGQTRSGYSSPNAVARTMLAAPDHPDTWFAVQFYRFVKGAFQNSMFGWDCRSEDWREHWSSNGELYCWNDLRKILNAAEAAQAAGASVTRPYDVALDWGRVPPTP